MTSQIRRPLFASRPPLQSLLSQLHKISLDQERAAVSRDAPVFFPKNWENPDERKSFDDKLVALDEDKASAMYLILRAMNAQRFFEGELTWNSRRAMGPPC
jgi:hypothetical protein